MTTEAKDIGDTIRLKATFTNIAGTDTDPTAIVLDIKEPDGVIVTKNGAPAAPDLTTTGTGLFHYDFAITKAGRHIVNWTGTGAVATAEEIEFYARRKEAVA